MAPREDKRDTPDRIDGALQKALGTYVPGRPPRSDSDLEALVAAERAAYLPEHGLKIRSSLEDDELFATAHERRRAVEAYGRFTLGEIEVIAAAIEHMTLHRLWASLYFLEEIPKTRRVREARKWRDEQRRRARDAQSRLRAFSTSVERLVLNGIESDVIDEVERMLARRVVSQQERLRDYETDLKNTVRDGPRASDAMRQRVAWTLRSRLPSWTSQRIAKLILASSGMRFPPCPNFVAEHSDPRRLADWFRQRVRDRRA